MAEKQRNLAANVRDIGPTPKCKHPKIREAFSEDLKSFCEHYFKEIFKLQWSEDHIKVIARLQDVILNGGLYLICCPRGFGKSSMVEVAALWSLLYAHRRFVVPIAATDAAAKGMLESLQVTLETNEKLMEDFPEVCHSITSLDHVSQRASGQLSEGKPTRVEFSKKRIVLPSLNDSKGKMSKVAGSIFQPCGLTSAIRGLKFKRSDGSIIRPDLVLLDDIQTRESADSPTQCDERMKLINSDVLGLAGPGKKISGVALGTVIRKGDAIDMLLNDDAPAWQGEKMKLIYKWPDTQATLWAEYAAMRREEQLSGETKHMKSNEFYKANFDTMNTGSKLQWEQRRNDDELSALQHAENLLLDRGEESFYSIGFNTPTLWVGFKTIDAIAILVV